ncbi:unnamed protein product [Mytilus edulis]|uniref:Peptidase A2 domain-containing protein n=1 Tax=Mytilus edulis TaxID=6550 RepID=A0A8S3R4F2_MYTED|nr:unnamed protein product [Mytilus edulis]
MPAPENAAGQQEAEIIQVPVNAPAEVMAPLNVPIVPAPQGPPPGFPVQRYNVNIELFTGKGNVTALEWWTMFVTFVTLQRMPEADALLVFPFHLAGVAKAWFNTLDTQTKSTFNNLKAAFLQRFKPTLNAGVKITELRQYAYETVDEYIDRALSLNSNNCVSEEFLISVTEKGFKKGMGHIILPNRSKTMHALREIANVAEMTIAVSGQPQMEDITSTINQAVCSAVKSVEANMLDSIMTRMDTTLSAMNRPDRRPDYRPEQHRVKFNTQQNHQYSTKSDECGYCGDAKKSTTKVSVGGTRTCALVDTGANISVMSKQFFLRTPYSTHKLEPPDITSVIAVNGNHVKVLGKVNISVTIGNRNFRASIYVLPQLHHSLILGVDFLKQTKAKLNFETDTFEIFENNDVVTLSRLTSKQGLAKTSKSNNNSKRSQTLISVAVSHQTHDSTVLLEPLKSLAHKHRILAAKALVKIKHGKAYLSLMNPTDNKVRIKARTKLAKVAHVKTETIQNFNDTKPSVSSIKTPNSKSCSDLKFDLSESDLTDSEKQRCTTF